MLQTEMRNPNTTHIDKATSLEIAQLMSKENRMVNDAIDAACESIAKAIDMAADAISNGGRLIYIGAGTSGRLGVLDAVECPPTFGVDRELVSGIIAGGEDCMFRAAEGEEDDGDAGVRDIKAKNLTPADTVVGISASGNASYVADALSYAKKVGCKTISISANYGCRLEKEADVAIVCVTGPEAITGSTRMKAGSAQKMILNMLSTCAMIKTGKVRENLMINLRPTNIKLKERVISIVCQLCKCDRDTAIEKLEEHNWVISDVVE